MLHYGDVGGRSAKGNGAKTEEDKSKFLRVCRCVRHEFVVMILNRLGGEGISPSTTSRYKTSKKYYPANLPSSPCR